MRVLYGLLVFVSLAVAAPQDSLDLRARYGEPTAERFEVLPGVTVTAEYERDGHAHVLEIEPRQPFLLPISSAPRPAFSEETAHQALEEVLPEARGQKCRMLGAMQAGQGVVRFLSCGKLTLSETSTAGARGTLMSVQVRANSGTLSATSKELHARYGKPELEVFSVNPDLMATAEYGEDGQACALRIEVAHNLGFESYELPEARPDELAAILDELVPMETRGKELDPGSPLDAAPLVEYEHVRIQPYYGLFSSRDPKVRGADVRFKRATCQVLQSKFPQAGDRPLAPK